MPKPPKKDELIRDAVACASGYLGDSYRTIYGNYLESHYLELLPESAMGVWLPMKQYVVAACHIRSVTSIPKAFHFPVMVLELAAMSRRLKPEEYMDSPYYVALRAIDLAFYKVELEPFMATMRPEQKNVILERLKLLQYK